MNYLEVVKGGKEMSKKVNVRLVHRSGAVGGLHPMLDSALKDLSGTFADLILQVQDCFEEKEGWVTLLELIPNKSRLYLYSTPLGARINEASYLFLLHRDH